MGSPRSLPRRTLAPLRVRLLGGFEVEREGDRIPPQAWRRRRPSDLLKIVAASPGRAIHREEVIARLWPDKYAGRPMKESHQHLHITEAEWQAMLSDFEKTLDKFKVPEAEQKELIAIVESTKKDIVAGVS